MVGAERYERTAEREAYHDGHHRALPQARDQRRGGDDRDVPARRLHEGIEDGWYRQESLEWGEIDVSYLIFRTKDGFTNELENPEPVMPEYMMSSGFLIYRKFLIRNLSNSSIG